MKRYPSFHPLALVLLAASLALAAACLWLPPLRAWSWLAAWLVVWGLATCAVTTAGLGWTARLAEPREVRQLRAIRQALARRLVQQRSQESTGSSPVWTSILAEAVERLDDDVEPALRELLVRHQALSRHLRLYDAGGLPLPDKDLVGRLKALEWRQRNAIHESVRQASNAEAALVALLAERQDGDVVERARGWTDELVLLHDTLVNALGGDQDGESQISDCGLESPPQDPQSPQAALRVLEPAIEAEYLVASARDGAGHDLAVLTREVEEALRALNNLSALANCDLLTALPHTLAAACARVCGATYDATPLEQSQAVHEVLCAAIERLKPPDGPDGSNGVRTLEHDIVFEEYVLRRSTRHIMVRHFVAEATFHRRRRAAIRAIASDLIAQEERLARGRSNGFGATLVGVGQ